MNSIWKVYWVYWLYHNEALCDSIEAHENAAIALGAGHAPAIPNNKRFREASRCTGRIAQSRNRCPKAVWPSYGFKALFGVSHLAKKKGIKMDKGGAIFKIVSLVPWRGFIWQSRDVAHRGIPSQNLLKPVSSQLINFWFFLKMGALRCCAPWFWCSRNKKCHVHFRLRLIDYWLLTIVASY